MGSHCPYCTNLRGWHLNRQKPTTSGTGRRSTSKRPLPVPHFDTKRRIRLILRPIYRPLARREDSPKPLIRSRRRLWLQRTKPRDFHSHHSLPAKPRLLASQGISCDLNVLRISDFSVVCYILVDFSIFLVRSASLARRPLHQTPLTAAFTGPIWVYDRWMDYFDAFLCSNHQIKPDQSINLERRGWYRPPWLCPP
ncbi:hypothetical protein RvY_09931-2 [Ramazzottius varieornatus]|uniref:Uncharacterized protein n=1 Tax=Ramazzottius varieornatus TaxID=947166 RepID=A0A1D1VB24_RAMVA|nr:hypothetical protein RvY_09931-2 [Ramazzottius varieornatus]